MLAIAGQVRYRGDVRSALAAFGVVLAAMVMASAAPPEQPVATIQSRAQQEIQILSSGAVQTVTEVERQPLQEVGTPVPVSSGKRAAVKAGKVVIGTIAVGIAVGAALASLLFI